MDIDELQDRLLDLETRHEQLVQQTQRDKQKLDTLAVKLQYPGTRLLIDLQYQMVTGFPLTVTLAAAQHLVPGVAGVHGPFDVRRDNQHAFYILSAKVHETGTFAIYYGTSIATTGGVSVAYAVYNNAGVQETWLDLYNATGAEANIDVILYRHLGIK